MAYCNTITGHIDCTEFGPNSGSTGVVTVCGTSGDCDVCRAKATVAALPLERVYHHRGVYCHRCGLRTGSPDGYSKSGETLCVWHARHMGWIHDGS